jgi:hypothetical protein
VSTARACASTVGGIDPNHGDHNTRMGTHT